MTGVPMTMGITEKQRERKALLASELRYRRLFETAQDGILILDAATGKIEDANPFVLDILGVKIDELLGKELWEIGVFTDIEKNKAAFRELQANGYVRYEEMPLKTSSGLPRQVEFVSNVYSVGTGNVIQCNIRDITDRKLAEHKHIASEALYRQVVENSQEGIWIHQGGRIIYANAAAARMFGVAQPSQLLGRGFLDVVHPDERHRAVLRTGSMVEHGSVAPLAQMKFLGAAGKTVVLEVQAMAVSLEGGTAIMTMGRDMTERRRLEDQLRQAQKMEAIGQLTGGIAHDFNNLLGIVIGNLDIVLEDTDPQSAQAKHIGEALNGAVHGAELTHRLLAFARQQSLEPKVFSLNEMLAAAAAMLKRTLGETIVVRVEASDDLWPAYADPSQVQDAVINLAINARDAMPHGGTITIETANIHLDEDYARKNAGASPGDYAMLAVTDTGTGMSPEVIEHAFEPFFTTKALGMGTGLGLSMVYGFANQSGGHLKIYSELGHGTSVKLYLPRSGESSKALKPAALGPGRLPGGSETVLIAEDNGNLRKIAVGQLTKLGYRILEAVDGESAVVILQGSERIDLLFSDIVMTGRMTGYDLVREARRLRPGIRVLLTTGYAERAVADRVEGGASLLLKPYRSRDLALKVRSTLDAE